MMAGGSWYPQSFRRFEQAFASSTYPARIVTDAGPAFIKVINNPLGPHVLVREWVGTSLAHWFGLPTFDFAILGLDELDEFFLHDNRPTEPGPAFVTRVVKGHPWSGDPKELKLLENPEMISRLIVFDTWTRNPDRYPPDSSPRKPNRDNVFLSGEEASAGKFRLIAMDHTECFTSSSQDLTKNLATISRIQDEGIYGLFPEFIPFVKTKELRAAASRLRELDLGTISDIVADIPSAWLVSAETREALSELILQRARYTTDSVVDRIQDYCRLYSGSLFID